MITEEIFVDFRCPYCSETVSFPEIDKGYARACPICTETLIVPQSGQETGLPLPLPVNTSRLILRRFSGADWRDLVEFMENAELFHFATPGPMNEDEVLRWLETDAQVRLTTPNQTFYLGIQLREGEKLVGFAGLQFQDGLQAMFHLVINPAFQRQGIGREALHGVLEFCFKGLHLHRLTAHCDSRNVAGLKLFESAGLRREGESVKDTRTPDGWANTVHFAKLEEEFG